MAASKDEMIAKAYAELERLGQDRDAMLAYERRLIDIRDQHAIRETAQEEGFQGGLSMEGNVKTQGIREIVNSHVLGFLMK